MPNKLFCILFFIFSNSFANNPSEGQQILKQILSHVSANNPDINLERKRYQVISYSKKEVYSNFLPEISLNYQIGRKQSDAMNINRGTLDNINDQNVKQLVLNQPIFSGFSGYHKLKQANFEQKAQFYEFIARKNDILLKSIKSYLDLFKYRTLIISKNQNLENAQKLLNFALQRSQLGYIDANLLTKYRGDLVFHQSELLNLKRILFEAQKKFENNIGFSPPEELILPANDSLDSLLPQIQKIIKQAASNNPKLNLQRHKIKSHRYSLKSARGKFSPTISLSASISQEENVAFLNGNDLLSKSIFLNFKIPIFQKGIEYHGYKKSQKELDFALAEYKNIENNLIQEIRQLHNEYVFYKEIIASHVNQANLIDSKITNIKEQIKLGKNDVFELVKVEYEFYQILEQALEYRINMFSNYYQILALIDKIDPNIEFTAKNLPH